MYVNYTNAPGTYNETTLIENSEAVTKNVFEFIYSISYHYYPLVALITSIIVGSLTSICTGLAKLTDTNDSYVGVCFKRKKINAEVESEVMLQSYKSVWFDFHKIYKDKEIIFKKNFWTV